MALGVGFGSFSSIFGTASLGCVELAVVGLGCGGLWLANLATSGLLRIALINNSNRIT